MSQTDLEVALRALHAFNRGDLAAFVAFMSPDVVWEDHSGFPDLEEVYRGHDAVRQWYEMAVTGVWKDFDAEDLGMRDEGGGRIVQDIRIVGTTRHTEIQADLLLHSTLTLVDGLIVHRDIRPAAA